MAGSLLCFGVKIVNEKTLVKRFTRFYFLFILVYGGDYVIRLTYN